MRKVTSAAVAVTTLTTLAAVPTASACVMTLPEPPSSSIEYEIEQEFEGYDSSTDRVKYKIEIEVEGLGTSTATTCECGLALGSTAVTAPSSFEVRGAFVGIRGAGDSDLPEFEGFEQDSGVDSKIALLPDINEGSTTYGFSVDVSSITIPTLGAGEILALIFEIQFDPDDFDQVNGNVIQFAAGSIDAGHELSLFTGYKPTLALPAFTIPEPGTAALALGLAPMTLLRKKRPRPND